MKKILALLLFLIVITVYTVGCKPKQPAESPAPAEQVAPAEETAPAEKPAVEQPEAEQPEAEHTAPAEAAH